MSPIAAFAPIFIQVTLTFALLVRLGLMRIRLVRSGTVPSRDYALGEAAWPIEVTQVANAFANQFELPVLFYLVTVLGFMTGRMSIALVVLAWLFVATRLMHALVHVTSNNIPRRFFTYVAGLCVLVAMWLVLLVSLATGL